MVWPVKLAVLYPHPGNSLPLWKGVIAGLALVLITVLVIRKARKIPYITVGWFWYVVTLIPVIGIVQVGSQAMSDRYTYITLIGLFVIIAWGANDLLSKWPHRKICLGTLAGILLPVLIVLTWKQVQHWENNITLFKHTLKHTSNNLIIHNNMGVTLDKQGRTEEAVKHFLQALRVMPDYAEAHYNLGNALYKQGRTEEAIEHFLQALRLKPDYAEAHNSLGVALDMQDRTEEAIERYLEALRLKPDYAEAHNNLGVALDKQGRIEEAVEHFLQALRLKPDISLPIALFRVEVHNNLAIALVRKGDIKGGIVHFREALRINPGHIDIKNNLNRLLMMQQKKLF
jgi:tetratricopeptide (TPR) repeat protein